MSPTKINLIWPRTNCLKIRRGTSLVLFAFLLPLLLLMVVIVVEITRVRYIKSQLQGVADAGALAGATCLRVTDHSYETNYFSLNGRHPELVYAAVQEVVAANWAGQLGPTAQTSFAVRDNSRNDPRGDVVLGRYSPTEGFIESTSNINSVRVVARFAADHPNGLSNFILSSLLPTDAARLSAVATARVEQPTLLPFGVYQPYWEEMQQEGNDRFSFDFQNQTVGLGTDGIEEVEVSLKDSQETGMPSGNFGWLRLGTSRSTPTLIRQIVHGPNEHDMNALGGILATGQTVAGIPGLRGATEAAFVGGRGGGQINRGIIGEPRLLALFDQASGQGANSQFRISKFVLVRVMSANLRGGAKSIVFQPIPREQNPNFIQLVQ